MIVIEHETTSAEPKGSLKRGGNGIQDTHRMELRSLPTLLAYALLSLVSLVFLLILKKTSSPCDVTTWAIQSATTAWPFHTRARADLDVNWSVCIVRGYSFSVGHVVQTCTSVTGFQLS